MSGAAGILRLVRFAAVGAVCSVVYAVMAWVLHELVGMSAVISSFCAYLIAIPVSFAGQKYFTFRSTGAVRRELPLFIAVQVLGLFLAAAVMQLVTVTYGLSFGLGTAAVVAVVPLSTYVMLHFGVFLRSWR